MCTFRALSCSALLGQNPITPRPGLSWELGFTTFYQFTPDLRCCHWRKKLGAAFGRAEQRQGSQLLTFSRSKPTTALSAKSYMRLSSSSSSGRAKRWRKQILRSNLSPAWLWARSPVLLNRFGIRAWHKHPESYKILCPVTGWVWSWVWPWVWPWVWQVWRGWMLTAVDCRGCLHRVRLEH